MLEIKNLSVSVHNKIIINNLNLEVEKGKKVAIMGPNGSGKSTLSNVIAGKHGYQINNGQIFFNGINILELDPEERAAKGIYLAFQYPVEIPGVTVTNFIKTAINANRKAQGLDEMPASDLLKKIRAILNCLGNVRHTENRILLPRVIITR